MNIQVKRTTYLTSVQYPRQIHQWIQHQRDQQRLTWMTSENQSISWVPSQRTTRRQRRRGAHLALNRSPHGNKTHRDLFQYTQWVVTIQYQLKPSDASVKLGDEDRGRLSKTLLQSHGAHARTASHIQRDVKA